MLDHIVCCGFANSYAVMAVLRVLVGMSEAVSLLSFPIISSSIPACTKSASSDRQPFFPGAILILSSFYTRQAFSLCTYFSLPAARTDLHPPTHPTPGKKVRVCFAPSRLVQLR